MKIIFVVAGVLFAGANAAYQNAKIDFDPALPCTACIRGGHNYCVTIGGTQNGTIMSEGCEATSRGKNNDSYIDPNGGVANGWVCSYALKDQMNSIVGACRPYSQQNLNDDCGSYFIDLSLNNEFKVPRSVFDLPLLKSCSYRAISKCGYPQLSWNVND